MAEKGEKKEIKLKVGELTERADFGRGIARLGAKNMKTLGVQEGNIIEIKGKHSSSAIAVRAYPADAGIEIIRMDGLLRRNCGTGVNEPVSISPAEVKEAKSVTIAPARKGIVIQMGGGLMKRNLLMRPVSTGDILIPNPVVRRRRNANNIFDQIFSDEMFFAPFGDEKFIVIETSPKGIVQITEATDVELLPEATKPVEEEKMPTVTYEDLGGLHDEVQKVREMIELPMRHPELFQRLGIEPPKGVLLHGPPGCLTGEALVAIEDGRLVRIGELGKNLVPGIYVADLPVYPPAHAKAIHVYDVPETVEITTKSGRRLRMTPNHPLMTDNGWVEAEKLKEGDRVRIFNWLPCPKNYVPTDFILNEKRLVNKIKVPKIWDEKLAELVGIFVAEGSIDARRIKFTIHRDESDLRERIIFLLSDIFDAEVTERTATAKAVRRIRVANRGIWDFFRPLWTKEKIIPQEILLSPNSVAAGFLRGLFEGDGSVVKKNRNFDRAVTLKSKHRRLLEEVQILLLRWGIRSTIYHDGNENSGIRHVLKIRGKENLRKFKENIGLISKIKIEKLDTQLSSYVRKTPNEDTDFEPIRTVKKVNGWERVYDFEIPTTHAFFSNGILSHNTGKTLLARAVANEAGVTFVSINGPEILSKWYGQSLVGSEKVLVMDNGKIKRMPIEEIVRNNRTDLKVLAFDEKGNVKFSEINNVFRHKTKSKIVEVKTKSGRKIRVTDDHSLFTLEGTKLKDIKTSELMPGKSHIAVPNFIPGVEEPLTEINLFEHLKNNDHGLKVRDVQRYIKKAIKKLGREKVAKMLGISKKYSYDVVDKNIGIRISNFLELMNKAEIEINPVSFKIFTKGKSMPAKIKLDKDFCTFLGLWVAEGSYTQKGEVRISINKDELANIKKLCKKLFGDVVVYNKKGSKGRDIYICHTGLGSLLQHVFKLEHGARKKKIPEIIFSLSKENIAAFLRGYYSGDGSIYFNQHKVPTIEATTESEQLADDLMYLLLHFGIVAKTYKRTNREQKRVCLTGFDYLIKFNEIGFIDRRRNLRIRNYIEKIDKTWKRSEQIPLTPEIKNFVILSGISHWEKADSIGKDILGRAFEEDVAECGSEIAQLIENNIYWDKVAEIKEMKNEEYVYDISVNPTENFVAGFGGIFAHNSEENLRKIFEQAEKNAPGIIFIDEVDAIAPKREEVTGEVERRVVSQLLSLMDGLKSRGQVIVIAATNRPNAIDPALRRGGRFDREIEIGVPDKKGREEILQIHTRGMPLEEYVSLGKIADITYGYVGADLAAICKEAAMHALRRALPELGEIKKDEPLPEDMLKKLIVTEEDFHYAMRMVEPSAMREVLIEKPKTTWNDIGGLKDVEEALKESVEWPLKNPESFDRMGIKPPKGVLLYGPPGCGKTLIARAVANHSDANFILVNAGQLLSKWVGESEKHLREVFHRAKQVSPSIIFFDEIDALVPRRAGRSDNNVTERVVSQMLTEMSGLEDLHDVVVLAATNRPDMLDPALLRPGRFDRQILVPTPDDKSRLEIFRIHTKRMPLTKDVDIKELAKRTENFTGADIEALCREAAITSLRKNLSNDKVSREDFEEALDIVKPSVPKELNEAYERIVKKKKQEKPPEEELDSYAG
ncbi:MAG: AAA family ATPase [Candidatus Aenigmarchaeota archaeon]|nr:AAA family ATPase [Candidatus Aenigmarchaeota archaeon]